jgi:hypothetical protein
VLSHARAWRMLGGAAELADPLRCRVTLAATRPDAVHAAAGASARWLDGLHTPEGCSRALTASLGDAEGDAARRRAHEVGAAFACVVDCDVFGGLLPPPAAGGRCRAYAAALKTASRACCARAPPNEQLVALVAAEGCLLNRAHTVLLEACARETDCANAAVLDGCSAGAARPALPYSADRAAALALLAELPARTLPLGKLLCLRDTSAAALQAYAAAAAAGDSSRASEAEPTQLGEADLRGADLLLPLLCELLAAAVAAGGCDIVAQLHFIDSFWLLNDDVIPAEAEDPRRGELGFTHTMWAAAVDHLQAVGRHSAPSGERAVAQVTGHDKSPRLHVRNASAPSVLELVKFRTEGAELEGEGSAASPRGDALGAPPPPRWLPLQFARWRARAPEPPALSQATQDFVVAALDA